MARRFNLDLDSNLELEGYDFDSRLSDVFEIGPNFATDLNPNLAQQSVFSDNFASFKLPSIAAASSTINEGSTNVPTLPSQPLESGAFGAVFELSSLLAANGGDGSAGFAINGIDAGDFSGASVSSAGDVNGDGFDDIIIGAQDAEPNGASSGESYVVFGQQSGFGASLNLSALNGTNGFVINGVEAGDRSGRSVSSAGDINGDGFDDIIIGARGGDTNGSDSGESYIVFGQASGFGASFDLSALNGTDGFVINGIEANDRSGTSVSSAGDVNGDGFDDFLIGAPGAIPNNLYSIKSYVVFGSADSFGASFDLSTVDGTNGFVINGIETYDANGIVVSDAGDVNGDGFDDILIGAIAGQPGGSLRGESYVVFGQANGFGASLDVSALDGVNGFALKGVDAFDFSGGAVSSAGDVNGDGFDDILIGAAIAEPNGQGSGESYVVFGRASGFAASLELSSLDGSNGFVINGINQNDNSGVSVSSAGDINGDGFDDILIGASNADPNGYSSAGEAYLIYGTDAGFAASFDLSSLDGVNGFVLNGIDDGDRSGNSVSAAGDVNGDGFDDILIGAFSADPNGIGGAGETYVIYGQGSASTPPPVLPEAQFELSSLLAANGGDGSAGFVVNGIDGRDRTGYSVSSAGDINGDGFDDFLIGADSADPSGNNSGETYVVFGQIGNFGASFDLSNLNGTNGFLISGIDVSDYSGSSVSSAGDINGDGFDDILIGAYRADTNGYDSGESYLIFGQAGGFEASLDLLSLDGTNGFVINGINAYDRSGRSVSSAGDFNGDGFDDFIIGATGGDPNGSLSGESYVIFGQAGGFGDSLELSALNGTNGFVINGIDASDLSGDSVASAGDVNGDGFDDILIGARNADPNGFDSGESYIILGQADGFGASFDLSSLNGTNGFVLNGIGTRDYSGRSVSSAGDINGDGFGDIIIGASRADPNGEQSGESYVVFGQENGFAPSFELFALNGSNGFVINGVDSLDQSGRSVSSAGDVNGDGFDDILIGAFSAVPNGSYSGESYIVFGQASGFGASLELSTLNGTNGFVLNGISVADQSGISVSSAGDIDGDGFDDILIGARYGDHGGNGETGETYIIYGQAEFGRTVEILSVATDSYTASNNGEVVRGLAGDDVINGGAGSDVLFGDEGDDTLSGNAGDDRLEGGAGNDTLDGGADDDVAIYNGNVSDYDIVNNGNGTFTVTDNLNGNGVDTLTNIEFVQVGIDIIDLTTILALVNGTPGDDDPLNGTTDDDFINGLAGDDVIFGLSGDDIINGGDGRDILNGGDGDDILNGDAGNDDFFGGAGADEINGGEGADRVFYSTAAAGVTANFIDQSLNTGEAAGDTYNSIESITGSNFDDVITSGNDDNDLVGLGGDDVLSGAGGRDRLFGGSGDDRLIGGFGNDDLFGQGGADTYVIRSGAGADRIFGYESGTDLIQYIDGPGDLSDLTIEQVGNNTRITSVVGVLTLIGITASTITADDFSFVNPLPDATGVDVNTTLTTGNDLFVGDENDDIVEGLAGNDTIRGGIGDDELMGGEGNDLLTGGLGADVLDGGEGIDRVLYTAASTGVTINVFNPSLNTGEAAGDTYISIENFSGSNLNDNITSGGEGNQLIGLAGNDTLIGAGGNDTLFGGDGNDRLVGGADNDVLFGQQGEDTFVFFANSGNDVIRDFEDGIDTIEFRGAVDSFADLTLEQSGTNVIITSDNGVITVRNMDIADLTVDDFTFL
ncbi:hypothetical protein N9W89_03045 [Hellea sp.]|nr:hypothetical protein [Hellea sp.]